MSLLLFIVGSLALMAGVTMAGYGIPINEFSFGNTLIVAGASLSAGGLIVIGLGAVVAQLQRLAEVLAVWTPVRSPVADLFDGPGIPQAAPAAGHVPFPPRPKPVPSSESEHLLRDAIPVVPAATATAGAAAAASDDLFVGIPSLRNPEIAKVEVDVVEEVSLSPAWEPSPPATEPPARTSPFDEMWPAASARTASAPEPVRAAEPPPVESEEAFEGGQDMEPPEAGPPAQEAEPEPAADEARAVAVLKSGVVDGMGYTLYVDGSIEAELPQGTLRFSSINDLRNYLEKNA